MKSLQAGCSTLQHATPRTLAAVAHAAPSLPTALRSCDKLGHAMPSLASVAAGELDGAAIALRVRVRVQLDSARLRPATGAKSPLSDRLTPAIVQSQHLTATHLATHHRNRLQRHQRLGTLLAAPRLPVTWRVLTAQRRCAIFPACDSTSRSNDLASRLQGESRCDLARRLHVARSGAYPIWCICTPFAQTRWNRAFTGAFVAFVRRKWCTSASSSLT